MVMAEFPDQRLANNGRKDNFQAEVLKTMKGQSGSKYNPCRKSDCGKSG